MIERNNQRNYVLVLALLLTFCCCLVTKSCLTLCGHMDWSLPGCSDCGISQARILEWVATSCSRGSSQPRDRTGVSSITGGFFTTEPPGSPCYLLDFIILDYGTSIAGVTLLNDFSFAYKSNTNLFQNTV